MYSLYTSNDRLHICNFFCRFVSLCTCKIHLLLKKTYILIFYRYLSQPVDEDFRFGALTLRMLHGLSLSDLALQLYNDEVSKEHHFILLCMAVQHQPVCMC